MENFKFFMLLFLTSNFISIAQNKTIVPKSGTIVFVKKDSVLDSKLYLQSYKHSKPRFYKALKEQIYLERLSDGKTTDTIQLNIMVNDLINLYEYVITEKDDRILKYYCNYENDEITKFLEVDGEKYKVVNFNAKTNTATDENNQNIDYQLLQTEIIDLIEFKNETKMINGYKCFKVVYQYKIVSESDFDLFSTILTNKRELWVTESIKSLYHPIINDLQILKKYYPLQIIEYTDELKGFQTNYTLENFTLE